jgi:hypothetical protein
MIKWWVHASYACHNDMRSQTGTMMTKGSGALYTTSTRQKINTQSSTEAEPVGVNNVMGQVLWTREFLKSQDYDVEDNVVYQDNKSAILLANNAKRSSGKRTRHMNIRYFSVTNRIKMDKCASNIATCKT